MKKFLTWIGGIVLFGAIAFGVTLCVTSAVNDRTIPQQWDHWTQQQETVESKEEVSDEIVIEDETQTEDTGSSAEQ